MVRSAIAKKKHHHASNETRAKARLRWNAVLLAHNVQAYYGSHLDMGVVYGTIVRLKSEGKFEEAYDVAVATAGRMQGSSGGKMTVNIGVKIGRMGLAAEAAEVASLAKQAGLSEEEVACSTELTGVPGVRGVRLLCAARTLLNKAETYGKVCEDCRRNACCTCDKGAHCKCEIVELYQDPDDHAFYCKDCWFAFGCAPPVESVEEPPSRHDDSDPEDVAIGLLANGGIAHTSTASTSTQPGGLAFQGIASTLTSRAATRLGEYIPNENLMPSNNNKKKIAVFGASSSAPAPPPASPPLLPMPMPPPPVITPDDHHPANTHGATPESPVHGSSSGIHASSGGAAPPASADVINRANMAHLTADDLHDIARGLISPLATAAANCLPLSPLSPNWAMGLLGGGATPSCGRHVRRQGEQQQSLSCSTSCLPSAVNGGLTSAGGVSSGMLSRWSMVELPSELMLETPHVEPQQHARPEAVRAARTEDVVDAFFAAEPSPQRDGPSLEDDDDQDWDVIDAMSDSEEESEGGGE